MITPAGIVTTLAGQVGVSGYADGTGTAASSIIPSESRWMVFRQRVHRGHQQQHRFANWSSRAAPVTTVAGQAGVAGRRGRRWNGGKLQRGLIRHRRRLHWNLYVSDTLNFTIRKVTSAGAVTMVAGGVGASGFTDATGTARGPRPQGLTLDSSEPFRSGYQ